MADPQDRTGVIACPSCGFSHLRGSVAHTVMERLNAWWTGTSYFRCQTCQWRGQLHDEWNPSGAFPDVHPLKLNRELDIEPLEERDEHAIVELLLSHAPDLGCTLRVWLDDSRPAPTGWLHLRSVTAAQALLSAKLVREMSLDHDLGWCADCIREGAHLRQSGKRHCPHTPTGYDLCIWMADKNVWPLVPPAVHSGNLEGGARMLGLIARRWKDPGGNAPASESASTGSGIRPARRSERDLTAMAQLTTCPSCGARRVIRAARGSTLARFRTMITRRNPVRCQACGWSKWVREPILVRLSSSRETPAEELSRGEFDAIDPDE
ncbi:MAG: hypothetical protein M3Q55_10855 [Acidobacteriota bacterium]|nr:hypothetical protein [Acidobacteriota bacterium]